MSTDQRTIDWYNQNAEEYAEHFKDERSVMHFGLEKPAMRKALPDISNKSALSLGCGSGNDTDYLRKQGASRAVGIDIAKNLVEIARKQYPECEFAVMDMEDLQFEDENFDLVYSSLAMHYLETWDKLFSEVSRVLKPGGEFLFSEAHPVSNTLGVFEDGNISKALFGVKENKEAGKLLKTYGGYFGNRKIEIGEPMAVTFRYRPFSAIIQEIADSDLQIKAMHEPKPTQKMKDVSERKFQKYSHIPWLMILHLVKSEN